MSRSFANIPKVSENVVQEDLTKRVSAENMRLDDINETPSFKPYSVALYDIDEALGFFFNEVLKPTVVQGGETISVPAIYGSPERWATMRRQGFFRDGKSKLILPLIMYRKTNITRNDAMYFPRLDQLYYISAKKWDNKNKYDNFSVLTGIDARLKKGWQNQTDRYALTSIPNYVIINYEGIVWTAFVEQMNKLIEKIQFKESTYWGDPKKFKFRTEIDGFDTAVELNTDAERMVKANFTMTLYGYLLPEEIDGKLTTRVSLSPKKLVFGVEEILDEFTGITPQQIISPTPDFNVWNPDNI
jgi:hypothetical protein